MCEEPIIDAALAGHRCRCGTSSVSGARSTGPRRENTMDQEQQSDNAGHQPGDAAPEPQQRQSHPNQHSLSRRHFLLASAITTGVVGTGLLIGFTVFGTPGKAVPSKAGKGATTACAPISGYALLPRTPSPFGSPGPKWARASSPPCPCCWLKRERPIGPPCGWNRQWLMSSLATK